MSNVYNLLLSYEKSAMGMSMKDSPIMQFSTQTEKIQYTFVEAQQYII